MQRRAGGIGVLCRVGVDTPTLGAGGPGGDANRGGGSGCGGAVCLGGDRDIPGAAAGAVDWAQASDGSSSDGKTDVEVQRFCSRKRPTSIPLPPSPQLSHASGRHLRPPFSPRHIATVQGGAAAREMRNRQFFTLRRRPLATATAAAADTDGSAWGSGDFRAWRSSSLLWG